MHLDFDMVVHKINFNKMELKNMMAHLKITVSSPPIDGDITACQLAAGEN